MSKERESLGSRLGFLLLTAGCAIGLGNIWRFPYVTGKFGGALFVAFYILFLLLMGLPLLIIELSVGRGSQRTLFGAAKVLPANKKFPWTLPAGIFFTGNIFPASSAIPPAFMYPPALNTPWRRSRSTAPSRGACWLSGESYGATPFPKAVTIRYRKPAASAANHHPL